MSCCTHHFSPPDILVTPPSSRVKFKLQGHCHNALPYLALALFSPMSLCSSSIPDEICCLNSWWSYTSRMSLKVLFLSRLTWTLRLWTPCDHFHCGTFLALLIVWHISTSLVLYSSLSYWGLHSAVLTWVQQREAQSQCCLMRMMMGNATLSLRLAVFTSGTIPEKVWELVLVERELI